MSDDAGRVHAQLMERMATGLIDMQRRVAQLEAQEPGWAASASYAESVNQDGVAIGVFNGQFELGPLAGEAAPEGWDVSFPGGASYIEYRTSGGFAGARCVRLGAVGAALGANLFPERDLPVDEGMDYAYSLAARGTTANTRLLLYLNCRDAAGSSLALIYPWGTVTRPGTAWVRYSATVGPSGTAWPANTRYATLNFYSNRDSHADEWNEIDNVIFRPA